jgi:hypothetical protein
LNAEFWGWREALADNPAQAKKQCKQEEAVKNSGIGS